MIFDVISTRLPAKNSTGVKKFCVFLGLIFINTLTSAWTASLTYLYSFVLENHVSVIHFYFHVTLFPKLNEPFAVSVINPIINGWISYYGSFCRSELYRVFREVNKALIWWARHKYKKLQRRKTRAGKFMENLACTHRYLFAHWRAGMRGSMV